MAPVDALAVALHLCWSLVAAARLGETQHVTRLCDQLLPYRWLTPHRLDNLPIGNAKPVGLGAGEPLAGLKGLQRAIAMICVARVQSSLASTGVVVIVCVLARWRSGLMPRLLW